MQRFKDTGWFILYNAQNKSSEIISDHNSFEHIELAAKLLDYFLRSNTSNINQNFITNRKDAGFQHRYQHIVVSLIGVDIIPS